MASDILIRRAGDGDGSALRAIRLEALRDSPDSFGTTFEEASLFDDDQWTVMARDFTTFFAERDGVVVGMARGGANDSRPGTYWLYGMYVTPSARGTTAATRLVGAVCDWARDEGAEEVYLHVGVAVARARAFYEKVGFEANGDTMTMRREPGLELLTMVKRLD